MIPSWLTGRTARKCVLVAALTLGVVGTALAVDTDNFEWDPQYNSGNWNEDKWINSGGASYPNGIAHNVIIEGRSNPVRAISLIDADVGNLTLHKKEITFDSVDQGGNTISVNGAVVIDSPQGNDTEIVLTDEAAIDTAG